MNAHDQQIVQELKSRLPEAVAAHLRSLIVFGSRARHDAHEGSDLDVVVLVDEKTSELENAFDEVAYQVMWDHDFKPIISLKVFAESRFRDAAAKGFSFYRNIEKEGICL